MTALLQKTATRPRRRRHACALVFAIFVAISSGPTAVARPLSVLDQAELAMVELRFDDARTLFQAALQGGGNDAAQTTLLYQRLAEIAASLGDSDDARRLYQRALVITPSLRLEDGSSPVFTAAFAEAFEATRKRPPLTLRVTATSADGLVIEPLRDAFMLLRVVRVRFTSGRRSEAIEARVNGRTVVGTSLTGEITARVTLLDEFKNVIGVRSGSAHAPLHWHQAAASAAPASARITPRNASASPSPPAASADPASARIAGSRADNANPSVRSLILVGSLAALTLTSAVYFELQVRDHEHTIQRIRDDPAAFTTAEYLEQRDAARSNRSRSRWSLALSGVLTVAAAVLWTRRSDDPPLLRATVAPDGVAASFSTAF